MFLAGTCLLAAIGLKFTWRAHVIAPVALALALVYVAFARHNPDTETPLDFPTEGDRVVFFTADWCMNCKVVHPTLETPAVREAMASARRQT